MERKGVISRIVESRKPLVQDLPGRMNFEVEAEGGCGVTGFACSVPVRGKHIFEPSKQMHNRGNGRGGGIAAMGFDHNALGVTKEVLEEDYILQIAVLEEVVMSDLENRFIKPFFRVDFSERLPHIDDYRDIPGMVVRPPEIRRYFVRVKSDVLDVFVNETGLRGLDRRKAACLCCLPRQELHYT